MGYLNFKKYLPIIMLMSYMLGILALSHQLNGVNHRETIKNEFYAKELAVDSVSASTVPAVPALKVHKIVQGDSLSKIAADYGVDVETIYGANPNISETIYPGEELVVLPQKGVLHTVDEGESLWHIANMYGVQVDSIQNANSKQDDKLAIGDKLFIPNGRSVRSAGQVSRGWSNNRFIWPAQGEISSAYGYRWGSFHAGIDIANDIDTPIRAAQAGTVVRAGWRGGYGYAVEIEHGHDYSTLYAHLADFVVGVGQYVYAGQTIAYMGSTGYSTGPHLHFEIRREGRPINPMTLLP